MFGQVYSDPDKKRNILDRGTWHVYPSSPLPEGRRVEVVADADNGAQNLHPLLLPFLPASFLSEHADEVGDGGCRGPVNLVYDETVGPLVRRYHAAHLGGGLQLLLEGLDGSVVRRVHLDRLRRKKNSHKTNRIIFKVPTSHVQVKTFFKVSTMLYNPCSEP
jgi:hypothetical protein